MVPPPRCRVCTHPDAEAIDQAILNGKSLKSIAAQFGFTYTKGATGEIVGDHKRIQRHRDQCMTQDYALAIQEKRIEHGVEIAKRLDALDKIVDLVIKDAKDGHVLMLGDAPMLNDDGSARRERGSNEHRVLLSAVREARGNAELRAKIAGAVPEAADEELDKIRKAQEDPAIRALLAQMDERMAGQ